MNNLINKSIRQYQILLKVRESNTSIIFKAYKKELDRYLALEVLKTSPINNEELFLKLTPIIKNNLSLSHPGIGTIIDYFIEDELICLVYNFDPIHTIQRYFNRSYSWKATSKDLVLVSQALTYAHENGITHGSINPHNIIINAKGIPVLFGFGIELFILNYYEKVLPGSWVNNLSEKILAPEVILENTYSIQSDIYAFGLLINEWVTGQNLIVGDNPLLKVYLRISNQQNKFQQNKNEIEPEIQKIIEKCIDSDVKKRFKSMQELSVLLARGALNYNITKEMIKKPLTYTPPPKRPPKIILVFLSFIYFIIIFLAGVYFQYYSSPQKDTPLQSNSTTDLSELDIHERTPSLDSINNNEENTIDKLTPQIEFIEDENEVNLSANFNQIIYPLRSGQDLPVTTNSSISLENVDRIIQYANLGLGEINFLQQSNDKKYIAIATSIGVEIIDSQNFSSVAFLDTSTWVSTVAFSQFSDFIATGDENGLIQVWNTNSWSSVSFLSSHTKGIQKLLFYEEDQLLFSLSADKTIKIWDIDTKKVIHEISEHTDYVTDMVITPDNQFLITGGKNRKIQFWDLNTKELVKTIQTPSQLTSVVVTPDSEKIIVGGSDHRIYLIDIKTDNIIKILDELKFDVVKIILTEDGGIIAGDQLGGIAYWDNQLSLLWKQPRPEGSINRSNILSCGHQLLYIEEGDYLISVNWQGITSFFDKKTGKQINTDVDFYNNPVSIKISHKNGLLAVQNDKNKTTLWDLQKSVIVNQFEGELVFGNPFSPDDQIISLKNGDKFVSVYDLKTGKQIYELGGHTKIETIDYIYDGSILVTGRKEDTHLWSVVNGQEIKVIKNFSTSGCTQIFDLSDSLIMLMTNYNLVLSASTPNSNGLCQFNKVSWMRAMDINMDKKLIIVGGNSRLIVHNFSFSTKDNNIPGANRKNINGLAVHPEGNILASSLDDHTIRLWNIANNEELIVLFGHQDEITDLEFTSNGKFLISSSKDGFVKIWGIP